MNPGHDPRILHVRVRKVTIVFLWCLIASIALCQMAILASDANDKAKVMIYSGMVVVMLLSMVRSLKRRNELATAAMAAPPAVAVRSGQATGVACTAACRHLTLGTGQLTIDETGSLRFVANETPKQLGELNWYDANLQTTSIVGLAKRLLRPFFARRRLREFATVERGLVIPRDRLRVAVAVDRMAIGPAIVVGYLTPNYSSAMEFDEFQLINQEDPVQFAQPTADSDAWVQSLNLAASPQLEAEALAYRKRVHRRQSLATWLFCAVLVGLIMLPIFGAIGVAIAFDQSAATGAGVVIALGGGIWVITSLFIGAILLATNR